MAKGLDAHRARLDELNRLGRGLSRRSGSACELCTTSGVPLAAYEVSPLSDEPDPDRCAFICEPCRDGFAARRIENPERWRCLTNTMWTDVVAAQVLIVRMLRRLADMDQRWASENLENLYLDPDVEAWANDPKE